MLTKKHFEVIADIISNTYALSEGKRNTKQVENAINYIRDRLADYFATENELFDVDRFIKSCNKSDVS